MSTDIKNQIEQAVKSSTTMAEAASLLGWHFSTFKSRAIKYGLYDPNQGKRGSNKPKREGFGKIPLKQILDGKFPQFQSYKLKLKLYEAGIKKNVCDVCGISEWMGKEIQCELDHIDGNSKNHKLENLRILCPNCHSQTDTFRFKKRVFTPD